ncbi:MAG: hypothetical protein LM517_07855 [Nitrosomonas sp.]|nr:hypothetical protein [Nitrosomonas sp.]
MTQNYKPAYPPEFRQQMVELLSLGKDPKQLLKEFGCHYTSIQEREYRLSQARQLPRFRY